MYKTSLLPIFLFCLIAKVFAQPSCFQDNVYATNFDGANGLIFDASGRASVYAEKPRTPTNLQIVNTNTSHITFALTPLNDNIEVAVCKIFKNGVKIDESLNPSYTATNLQSATTYLFNVTAKDAAGNVSTLSNVLGTSTLNIATEDMIIYGDALHSDWNSVSSTISSLYFFNTTPPFINTTSIKVTNPTINQALDLRYNATSVDTSGYSSGLSFWVYNEGNTAFPLQIQTFNTNTGTTGSNNINVNAEPNQWTHFQFEWSFLGNPTQVGRIVVRLNQSQAESLYFDEIKLLHCADMQSVKTGNWNDASVWSCGRTPIVTDEITINAGHTVSIPNGINATLKFLYLLGTLNPLSGSTFNIYKF